MLRSVQKKNKILTSKEFYHPLQELGIISPNESWMLFGPIEDIVRVNEELLRRLEERLKLSRSAGKNFGELILGDIFSEMV